jgi:Abortive infection alpha
MHDPNALVPIALSALEAEAKSFLEAVITEPAKALGGLLTDQINAIKHRNLINIVVRANRRLAGAGLSPKQVPLKLIHPLLESGSLEEEPDLQDRWANLLSHAANPNEKTVPVVFVSILRELSSREVTFLDALMAEEEERKTGLFWGFREADLRVIYTEVGLGKLTGQEVYAGTEVEPFEEMIDILVRNRIISITGNAKALGRDDTPNNARRLARVEIDMAFTYQLTELGGGFVRACRGKDGR